MNISFEGALLSPPGPESELGPAGQPKPLSASDASPADRSSRFSSLLNRSGAPGRRIAFGLGPADNRQARESVAAALKAGYRHLDTAPVHGHEKGVGRAIREAGDHCGLSRAEICVGTTLPPDSHSYDAALATCEKSLDRLGLEWIDLLLLNWPAHHRDRPQETWKAMARLKRDGLAGAIGVINCPPGQVDVLVAETGERPAVNQLELNPYRQGCDFCLAMELRAVPVEARSPFGDLSLNDPLFLKLAVKHGRTPAQIVLRWHLECGRGAVSMATTPRLMRENLTVFDFRLDVEDMRRIALLDRAHSPGLGRFSLHA